MKDNEHNIKLQIHGMKALRIKTSSFNRSKHIPVALCNEAQLPIVQGHQNVPVLYIVGYLTEVNWSSGLATMKLIEGTSFQDITEKVLDTEESSFNAYFVPRMQTNSTTPRTNDLPYQLICIDMVLQ